MSTNPTTQATNPDQPTLQTAKTENNNSKNLPKTPEQKSSEENSPASKGPISIAKLKKLSPSAYILIILGVITFVILISILFIPKKGTKPANVIDTDNIPEPQISITDTNETKETPFTSDIIRFKKDADELEYNYPKYNLPVVETKINLSK